MLVCVQRILDSLHARIYVVRFPCAVFEPRFSVLDCCVVLLNPNNSTAAFELAAERFLCKFRVDGDNMVWYGMVVWYGRCL